MKRALLSGFDPLPHALSTKGLSALVAVVVLGTGFTVHRYLESSQSTSQCTSQSPSQKSSSQFEWPSEVRAADSQASAYGYVLPAKRSTESHARGCCGWKAQAVPHARAEAATSQTSSPTTPSMFQPEGDSVGG